jgi:hypothetical protein
MSNALNYLPDGFDHQLWLILVDIMAAVFGHKEACVRYERCRFFVVSLRHGVSRRNAGREGGSESLGREEDFYMAKSVL